MTMNWSPIAQVYHPLTAGSIDGTDTRPHDRAVERAIKASYVPPSVDGDPNMTIFVSRLNPDTTEKTLQKTFSKFGDIKKVTLIRDLVTGFSKQYAFIEFEEEWCARRAINEMDQSVLEEHILFVDWECERTLEGWIPRRLGGGFGGRKESGQLRFGGRDRPFRKPIMVQAREDRDNNRGRDRDDRGRERRRDRDDRDTDRGRDRDDRDREQHRDRADRDNERRRDRDSERRKERDSEKSRDRGDRDRDRRRDRDDHDRDRDGGRYRGRDNEDRRRDRERRRDGDDKQSRDRYEDEPETRDKGDSYEFQTRGGRYESIDEGDKSKEEGEVDKRLTHLLLEQGSPCTKAMGMTEFINQWIK